MARCTPYSRSYRKESYISEIKARLDNKERESCELEILNETKESNIYTVKICRGVKDSVLGESGGLVINEKNGITYNIAAVGIPDFLNNKDNVISDSIRVRILNAFSDILQIERNEQVGIRFKTEEIYPGFER